jgi:glycosyltransferase involved in cell wall biosynthesis
MKDKMVTIIIPAYNEAEYIGITLANLQFDWIKEIIVVDDGSKDQTYDVVNDFNVDLYRFSKNQGKGEAVTFALDKADSDIILLIDADLGDSVGEIEKLVIPIFNEETEITIAEIPIRGGGIGVVRKSADFALFFLTKKRMKAPLSGQRAFRRNIINDFLPLSSGFGLEIGMDIEIFANQYNYKEVPCDFKHNITGHSTAGYYHRFKQLCDIVKTSVVKGYSLKIKQMGF